MGIHRTVEGNGMKCPNCGSEIQEEVVCPKCGAARSEDFFKSPPEERRDTEYRLTLGGYRMVTCRRDLRSFILLLIVVIILLVLALVLGYLT